MKATTNPYQQKNDEFLENLRSICKNRGMRAELKKWWSPTTRHYSYPVLGRLGAIGDEAKTITAALYSLHYKETKEAHQPEGKTLGDATLKLAGGNSNAPEFTSTERHFRRLLGAETTEELTPQLQRLIKRFIGESIQIDYSKLLSDLYRFKYNPELTKTQWAIDFWQGPNENQ